MGGRIIHTVLKTKSPVYLLFFSARIEPPECLKLRQKQKFKCNAIIFGHNATVRVFLMS